MGRIKNPTNPTGIPLIMLHNDAKMSQKIRHKRHILKAKQMTRINKTIFTEATTMFLQGIKINKISKTLKKSRRTIGAWRKKYRWDDQLKKLADETRKKEFETNEKRLERMLKMSKAVQGKFAKEINSTKITVSEVIKAMEFEARMCGMGIQRVGVSNTDWVALERQALTEKKKKEE